MRKDLTNGINLYNYVDNYPVIYTDLLGLKKKFDNFRYKNCEGADLIAGEAECAKEGKVMDTCKFKEKLNHKNKWVRMPGGLSCNRKEKGEEDKCPDEKSPFWMPDIPEIKLSN